MICYLVYNIHSYYDMLHSYYGMLFSMLFSTQYTMGCYLVHNIHSYYGMLFSTQYTFILWAVLLHMHIRDGSLCFRSSPLFYSLIPLNLSYYSSTPLPLFLRLFHSQVQNSNCKLLCTRLELSTSTDPSRPHRVPCHAVNHAHSMMSLHAESCPLFSHYSRSKISPIIPKEIPA